MMAQGFMVQHGSTTTDIERAAVVLDRDSFVFDETPHAPKVQSVTIDGKKLVELQDYVAYIPPATETGDYAVIISGMGDYSGAKSVPWKITQAQGSISIDPPEVEITGPIGNTATAKLKVVGDGEIVFGESPYVSAARTGDTVTFTSKAEGSGEVTITLRDGKNYLGGGCRVKVKVTLGSRVLEENSWELIAQIAAAGKASDVWSVGDIKKITLTGYDDGVYGAQIIGFGQDVLDPTDERYNDPAYNGGSNKAAITFQFVEILSTSYYMNTTNDNSCSWRSCLIRILTMPKMLNALESELIAQLRTVTKKAPQSYNDKQLISTADKLFLLGPHEISKSPNYADFEAEGEFYQYYASGNSTVKKKRFGSPITWLLRCPSTYGLNSFCCVGNSGNSGISYATTEDGVAPAFCI